MNTHTVHDIAALLPFLKPRSTLRFLDLAKVELGEEGATRMLSEALDYIHSRYRRLNDNISLKMMV